MFADVLLCSHPRSGGRWLRHLVAHYLVVRHALEIEVTPENVFAIVPDHDNESERGYRAFRYARRRGFPRLAVCHRPYTPEYHRSTPIFFLARNAYDVVVSAYHHLTYAKGERTGSMREFLHHPRYGVPSWIDYMNRWAPHLLTHTDASFLAYGRLSADPDGALRQLLEFIDEEPDPVIVSTAVSSSQALRDSRKIRTGQEGNFWDHLQPEEIFDIQEQLQRGLSQSSRDLLRVVGVELDPFPRTGQDEED